MALVIMLVREHLNRHFQQKWIGNTNPVYWPLRSSDLSILNFFVWGHVKNKIYERRHEIQQQLLDATREAFQKL